MNKKELVKMLETTTSRLNQVYEECKYQRNSKRDKLYLVRTLDKATKEIEDERKMLLGSF